MAFDALTDTYGWTIELFEELNLTGTDLNDRLLGDGGDDTIVGGLGSDTILGEAGDDQLNGGSRFRNDITDTADWIYAGDGDDWVGGGYGNDELRGDAGDDTLDGGFGADLLVGGTGDDIISGSALGDRLFGGAGADFLNGGFGFDRLNGGAGADRFYHLGVADHGSDWIQDYSAAQGDVLELGGIFAGGQFSRDQLQVNFTDTENAGVAGVEEAFVIHRPTGQILWALVDGAMQDEINVRLYAAGDAFDLLG